MSRRRSVPRIGVAAAALGVAVWVMPGHAQPARPAAPAASAQVVAEVGTKRVTVADVQEELAAARSSDAADNRLDAFSSDAKARALDRIVSVKLLALGADERKLGADPDIRRRLDNVVDQSLAAVLATRLASTIPMSADALHKYYDDHVALFSDPGRARARHIVVGSRAEAEDALRQLHAGSDFAAFAGAHNIDATRGTGGELGWISRGVMVPAFEQAVFSTKAGETSGVVQTSFGYHIVQVEDVEPARPRPFEQVSEQVKQRLLQDALDGLQTQLRAKYPVKIDESVLAAIDR